MSEALAVQADSDSSARQILTVRDLTVRFGGIVALKSIALDVAQGEICGVIGPNGAGKTTFFNCLSRLNPVGANSIIFDGVSLHTVDPSAIAALGIGRTFQNLALFGSLSVLENIMLGSQHRARVGWVPEALWLPSAKKADEVSRQEAWELAGIVGLQSVAHAKVSDLPFGFRKRVELARALAAKPKLLLLDEPAAGLIHDEVEALGRLVVELRDRFDLTVLMVEHNMGFIMKLCEHVVVLNFGEKIADSDPTGVQANPAVLEAYLGAPQ